MSFVLAPLASNASKLIAAYNYSLKKTPASIGISLSTLCGAAVMNNTFGLGEPLPPPSSFPTTIFIHKFSIN